MLNISSSRDRRPAGAPGYRAYAVGDVHGRLDLLEELLAKIHAELQHRPARKT
jgi:serine/threonine protein phosphatase 1